MIPLIDLSIDKKLSEKIKKQIINVIESNNYILGPKLESFERKFAKFIGVKYAIGVASGTDALRLSLRALGIGQGDKVLTVSLTSPFTAIAIVEEGAIPVFCDVDEETWTIDIEDAKKKIDKKTKAIIPVHQFGNPSDMESNHQLAKENDLKDIEDACQAHGAKYKGKMIGSLSDTVSFSFYPTKNLGAFGNAGMVTTNNSKVAKMIKLLRHGGQTKRFWHEYKGINSRLDEIQAAILSVKLRYLEKDNEKRRLLAKNYLKGLSSLPINFQQNNLGGKSVYHLFAIYTEKRNALQKFLQKKGIQSDIYYPYPVHLQPAFRKFKTSNLKRTNKICKEIIALPLFPSLGYKKQDYIIKAIRQFFEEES